MIPHMSRCYDPSHEKNCIRKFHDTAAVQSIHHFADVSEKEDKMEEGTRASNLMPSLVVCRMEVQEDKIAM